MKNLLLLLLSIFIISCNSDIDSTGENKEIKTVDNLKLFEDLHQSATGINFNNKITEGLNFNYINYDAMYQGAGLALSDLDNDGLVDIIYAGNQVNNQVYKNKGDFKFENITDITGLADKNFWASNISIADVNNDGLNDIYICNFLLPDEVNRKNQLFLNQGNFRFKEVANEWGIDDAGYSTCATFFDMDNDGDADLYVGNQMPTSNYQRKRQKGTDYRYTDNLYRNDGDKFTKVTETSGIKNYAPALSITASDLNNDGFIDLYVANDYEEPDFVYLNVGDGTFVNSANVSLKHMSNFSMGADIADINNDGFLDVFCADMVAADNFRSKTNMSGMNPEKFWKLVDAGYHHQYMFNALQLNNGNGTFSEIAQMAGVSNTDWSWSTLFGDYDLDGYKDLVISNGLFRDVRNKDYEKIKKEKIKTFNKSSDANNIDKKKEFLLELSTSAPSFRLENKAYKNNGDLTFTDVSSMWNLNFNGWTQGYAFADLDNDGDIDLVANNMNDNSIIYKNTAVENELNNWLKVNIKDSSNKTILGSRVTIEINGQTQTIEITNNRGIFSSSEPVAIFGLGQAKSIDKLTIDFLDGNQYVRNNIKCNQSIVIDKTDAKSKTNRTTNNTLFQSTTADKFFPITHNENEYDDYKREILIPHKMSTLGPVMAKADVDGNGTEDIFFGGSAGMTGAVFTMSTEGKYTAPISGSNFSIDKNKEDSGACFFDVDGDGDQDLFVVSGGNEFDKDSKKYGDRLYINNGKGVFTKDKSFRGGTNSGSIAVASDYDKDGDLDLFVGGRQVPGFYGYNANSTLYKNENGKLIIAENSNDIFNELGMVTDAVWSDYDGDNDDDLIVVGEWMPITIFNNESGILTKSNNSSLNNTSGWWNRMKEIDIDGDGDQDYIAGNLGLNIKFKASEDKPFKLYTKDFDGNGTHDVYLGYYDVDGKLYPVRGRQCSSEQMPFVKEKFKDYESFAVAGIEEVLDEKMEGAELKAVQIFESVWIENKGKGDFEIHKLPNEAQIAPVYAILTDDFDQDGDQDVFVAGNYHNREVETTRSDAGTGTVLINDGKGNFNPMSVTESGIYASYDVRDAEIVSLPNSNEKVIIIANNNERCQSFKLK